jgi:hypothetical protein
MGIVGVARLIGYLDLRDPERRRARALLGNGPAVLVAERMVGSYDDRLGRTNQLDEDPWWTGPCGWLLDRVVAIEPVACKGAQGLWTVPEPQLSLVLERSPRSGARTRP